MQSEDQIQAEGDPSSTISFSRIRFKVQNVLSEFRILKDQDKLLRKEVEELIQRLKHSEAERGREISEFQTEIASANDTRQKLEETIRELSNEADASTIRERSLKSELRTLLQTRSSITEQLKTTNYKLERSLNERSDELATALGKLRRHSALVEAIEREASSVNRTVDETRQLVQAKEDEVMQLQMKLNSLADFDKEVFEKIKSLEQQVRDGLTLESTKNKMIMELEENMELLKSDHRLEEQLLISQKTIDIKHSSISKLNETILMLESQIESLEGIVKRSEIVLKEQRNILENTQREVVSLEDTIQTLQARLHEAEEKLDNSVEEQERYQRAAEDELNRKAELELQLGLLQKRNQELEIQHLRCSGVDKSTSSDDLTVMERSSMSTCHWSSKTDKSSLTEYLLAPLFEEQPNKGDKDPSEKNKQYNRTVSLSTRTQRDQSTSTDDLKVGVHHCNQGFYHSSEIRAYCHQSTSTEESDGSRNCGQVQLEAGGPLGTGTDQTTTISNMSFAFPHSQELGRSKFLPVDWSAPTTSAPLGQDIMLDKGDGTEPPLSQEDTAAPTDVAQKVCYGTMGGSHNLRRGKASSPDLEFDVEMLLRAEIFPDTYLSQGTNLVKVARHDTLESH